MFKLHYADWVLKGDIPCYDFYTEDDLFKFLNVKLNENEVVVLVAIDGEVFVSDTLQTTEDTICPFISLFTTDFDEYDEGIDPLNIYIQEYLTYEEAYSSALSMKEVSALCYKQNDGKFSDN